jgi:hypothetical protein
MNAAEHIVDAYFRLTRGCFTLADKKVANGNNRQLDILAYHLNTQQMFHIEVGVTHQKNWCLNIDEFGSQFEKKFFGAVPERKGKSNGTTDFEKGKSYWEQIQKTYEEVGFDREAVKRVWVCWIVKNRDGRKPIEISYFSPRLGKTFEIQMLSLRDYILPELENTIGTANYDDEILRVLGFVKQRELQSAIAPEE